MKYKVLSLKAMDPIGHKMMEDADCEVITAPDGSKTEDFIKLIKDNQVDAIYCRVDKVTKEMIDASKNLKVISKQGVGLDNIDMEYASSKKIPVGWAPGGNATSVAEHTILLMMMCAVRYRHVDSEMRKGNFNVRYTLKGTWELTGQTLGLLGCGRIGQIVAKIASQGFGMKVIGYDPFPPKAPLVPIEMMSQDEVLKQADFVSLHMPSMPSTVHSINYDKFCMMKPSAFFINCARGDVIVEDDLVRALNEKKIAGAGIDVFEKEPLPLNDPLVTLDNVVLTPHTSATTIQSVRKCTTMACQCIIDALNGKIPVSYQANKF
ncbi:MAG: hydroxyacid dehydrogenase [Oscillospiraceae bacterium]|jgi:D-3-phosphoglycerate dehydrogenase|nr:hydroxyacid dehydrogenase [Oscillospiraceae bacterium]MCI2191855.1 hydroxyacid dehydrogenase [Oscillospiraceae bacterium]MCI2205500.1 hydroxyacid dehydrogenase [Oscillospiraceae bacterium]